MLLVPPPATRVTIPAGLILRTTALLPLSAPGRSEKYTEPSGPTATSIGSLMRAAVAAPPSPSGLLPLTVPRHFAPAMVDSVPSGAIRRM